MVFSDPAKGFYAGGTVFLIVALTLIFSPLPLKMMLGETISIYENKKLCGNQEFEGMIGDICNKVKFIFHTGIFIGIIGVLFLVIGLMKSLKMQ